MDALENIEAAKKLLEMNGYFVGMWLPIDVYPNDGSVVFSANTKGIKLNGQKTGETIHGLPTGWDWSQVEGSRPTHWMPLPPPPKGEE